MKKKCMLMLVVILLIGLVSAGSLKVTQEHPFLINGKWIPASSLEVGDELTTLDGSNIIITNIKDILSDKPVEVYNLEANPYNNFIVSQGVVVHNSDVGCSNLYNTKINLEFSEKVYRYRIEGEASGITQEEFEEAQNILFENNKGLIKYLVYEKYAKLDQRLDESERLSAAYFAFPKAIQTYDPNRGTSFGGWLKKLIEQSILRDLTIKVHGTKGLPSGYLEVFEFIDNFKLTEETGPTIDKIIEQLPEWGEEKIRNAVSRYTEVNKPIVRIDRYYDDGDVRCFENPNSVSPFEEAVKNEDAELIQEFIESDILTANMRTAYSMHTQGYDLSEIGMAIKMREDGFTESEFAEAINLKRELLRKSNEDSLNKVITELKTDYRKDDNFVHLRTVRNWILNAKISDDASAKDIEALNLKNKGYSNGEIVLIFGMREGGYSQKQIDDTIKKYGSYTKSVSEETRLGMVKDEIEKKYKRRPEFLSKQRVGELLKSADRVKNFILNYGHRIPEFIDADLQAIAEGMPKEAVMTTYQREVMALYHGLAYMEPDGNVIFTKMPGKRYSFKEIAEMRNNVEKAKAKKLGREPKLTDEITVRSKYVEAIGYKNNNRLAGEYNLNTESINPDSRDSNFRCINPAPGYTDTSPPREYRLRDARENYCP